MADHTPGPWDIREYKIWGGQTVYSVIDGEDGEEVTLCQNLANARMIAAAPDMLEILERSLVYLADYRTAGIFEDAKEVIAKARG